MKNISSPLVAGYLLIGEFKGESVLMAQSTISVRVVSILMQRYFFII